MKFLLLTLLTIALYASDYKSQFKALTNAQMLNAEFIYTKALPHDLELTMVSIAHKESKLGEWSINLSDPSCGMFHNLLTSVATRESIRPNQWNLSRICDRLIQDKQYAFDNALQELLYWRHYWSTRTTTRLWSHMVGSYNGGFKPNFTYATDVLSRVRTLEKMIKETE